MFDRCIFTVLPGSTVVPAGGDCEEIQEWLVAVPKNSGTR